MTATSTGTGGRRAGWPRGVAFAIIVALCLPLAPNAPGDVHAASPGPDLPGTPGATPARPDIVVLMLDDVNADAFPLLLERLPNLRAVFQEHGVRFPNTFAQDPLCCPARAAFLTGQTTDHHGVHRNDARLLDPRETIATALDAAGYLTFIAGKYLNLTELLGDRTPPGWDRAAIMSGAYRGYLAFEDGRMSYQGRAPRDYSTDHFADRSVAWLRAAPARGPRFLFLTPYAPHGDPAAGSRLPTPAARHRGDTACQGVGFHRSPAFDERPAQRRDRARWVRELDRFRGMKEYDRRGWPLRRVCESLLAVDEWFGRVVRVQRRAVRHDRTLYLLTADNGMSWGDHGHFAKEAPWTTRVPLYLSWPDGIGDGPAVNSAFVQNIDLAPTLAEIAGTRLGPFPGGRRRPDGVSLLPTILGGAATGLSRTGIAAQHQGKPRLLRWRALRTTGLHPCGLWHYTRWSNGDEELFDLTQDPWELVNVAPDHPILLAQMRRELRLARRLPGRVATTCAEPVAGSIGRDER